MFQARENKAIMKSSSRRYVALRLAKRNSRLPLRFRMRNYLTRFKNVVMHDELPQRIPPILCPQLLHSTRGRRIFCSITASGT